MDSERPASYRREPVRNRHVEPGLLVKTPLNTARLEESTTGHNGLDAPLISDAMQCVSDRAGVID